MRRVQHSEARLIVGEFALVKCSMSSQASHLKSWGHVGTQESWGMSPIRQGESGVARLVSADVLYAAPPHGRCWAFSAPPQRLFLTLEGEEEEYSNLLRFGESVCKQFSATYRKSQKETDLQRQDDLLLDRLDGIVNSLIKLTGSLHSSQCGLGMLTPECVIVRDMDVILTDLGFTFRDGVFPPGWYEHPKYSRLWDADVGRQQERGVSATVQNFDGLPDVRLLGRLLQGVLTGSYEQAPYSGKELPAGGSKDVLRYLQFAILSSSTCNTLQKLSDHIQRNPLSHHFRGPVSVRNGKGGLGVIKIASTILIMSVGGWLAVANYLHLPPFKKPDADKEKQGNTKSKGDEPPLPPAPDQHSDPVPLVDIATSLTEPSALETALQSAPNPTRSDEYLSTLKRADVAALSPDQSQSKRELGRLSFQRGKFFDVWSEAFQKVRADFNDPAKKSEAYKSLLKLRDELLEENSLKRRDASPATLKKEIQCLEAIRLLANDPQVPELFSQSLRSFSGAPSR